MSLLTFVDGKCYSYQDLKFYATNGYICLHDEEDGDFRVVTRREFLHRMEHISAEAAVLKIARKPSEAEHRNQLQHLVADMIECCQEAKDQGDHEEPDVMAWFIRHRPGRKSSVSFGSPNIPRPLPRGRFTGRTAKVDSSVYPAAVSRADLAAVMRGEASPRKLLLPSDML